MDMFDAINQLEEKLNTFIEKFEQRGVNIPRNLFTTAKEEKKQIKRSSGPVPQRPRTPTGVRISRPGVKKVSGGDS